MEFSLLEMAAIAIALDEEEAEARTKKNQVKRKWSVHPLWRRRQFDGEFNTLCRYLPYNEDKFFGYFRMSKENFDILLNELKSALTRQQTRFKTPIEPKQRLAVCLRYLATGDSYLTISFSFRLGHTTVHQIVNSTCRAIVNVLMKKVMPQPSEDNWKLIAHDFETLWKFPNCIGALDGKHLVIEAPPNIGSIFYNYKNTFSIILLALVDARYKFITVNVGSYERNSDGGVFAKSSLGQRLENGTLIADEAFPLKTYIMRPYPGSQTIGDAAKTYFNYRLTLARRLVECAFCILAQRFRLFFRRIKMAPINVDNVILAACTLHNFLRNQNDVAFTPRNTEQSISEFRQSMLDQLRPQHHGQSTNDAFAVREKFKNYFLSPAGHF
ncbi:hypothetical protein ABMA27_008964 [Loxostege sticticalis]|uniref:DDE Tnp4 domain-containing protein n=1 Tax=Loxostege sticticalis TaxID=481309 RepID=A0ABR3H9X4_LOXSC